MSCWSVRYGAGRAVYCEHCQYQHPPHRGIYFPSLDHQQRTPYRQHQQHQRRLFYLRQLAAPRPLCGQHGVVTLTDPSPRKRATKQTSNATLCVKHSCKKHNTLSRCGRFTRATTSQKSASSPLCGTRGSHTKIESAPSSAGYWGSRETSCLARKQENLRIPGACLHTGLQSVC